MSTFSKPEAKKGPAAELGRSNSFSHSIKTHFTNRFQRFNNKHKRSQSAMSATTDSMSPSPMLTVNNKNTNHNNFRQFHRPVATVEKNVTSSQQQQQQKSTNTTTAVTQPMMATSAKKPMPARGRTSLLNAPPMTKVWLDDDDSDSDISEAGDGGGRGDNQNSVTMFNAKLKPKDAKITIPTSLRRFGSNKKKQESLDFGDSNNSNNTPSAAKTHHKQSSSVFSFSQESLNNNNPGHSSSHSRSNSATNRIRNFLSPSSTPSTPNNLSPSKISAPTNFVHTRHIDAEYLRGSSADKRHSPGTATNNNNNNNNTTTTPFTSSNISLSIPEHQTLQRSASERSSPTSPNKSPNRFNRRPYHHRHEDSGSSAGTNNTAISSTSTTTTTTTTQQSRPTSAVSSNGTPATSLNPSPMYYQSKSPHQESNLVHDQQQQQPPRSNGQLNSRKSIESFASWGAASSNADFLEQQKWLLHTTESLVQPPSDMPFTLQKSPYSCYYATSATASNFNSSQPKTPSSSSQRKSVLLPSPSLPVSNKNKQQVSEGGKNKDSSLEPITFDPLSYGPPLSQHQDKR